ncbi:single-stranded DNA-binding protein [Mycoplasma struthionis]|uniref:Single-stranded DNA-binding protein n=1 Tax=Mycoplasma struthionis TaxID=538220 RepID=A0A3G8LGT5_9MOLU|nr:single-stranded DNA-binding protein [Mycoplasma struthionis]AZG68903.1 single-stranded DNA-binding protein [Mycoplasma struthionis]TPI01145.1 single-stranded DNA-binding protein [Mycoplasma struthionis]
MNKVIIVGRLAQDPYKGITKTGGIEYSRFTVAVNRAYKGTNGEQITDYIPCVAWRTDAIFVNNYLSKGSLVSIEGSFQSSKVPGQFDQLVNSYSVAVDRIASLESREASENRKKTSTINNVNNNYNNNQEQFSIPEEQNLNQPETVNDDVSSEIIDLDWQE